MTQQPLHTNHLAVALVRAKLNTPEFWTLARKYATAPSGAARHAAEDAMLGYVAAAITPPASAGVDLGVLATSVGKLASWLEEHGFPSSASEVGILIDLIPLRVTAREHELLGALERLCTHEARTSAQIDSDWDYARNVLVSVAPTHGLPVVPAPEVAVVSREPFDFDEWFSEHSEGAQLRIGKDLRDFERAITEWADGRGPAAPATEAVGANEDDAEDARLWRYTQQKGYFSVGKPEGGRLDVAVGVQQPGQGVTEAIQGRGATLKEAIQDALSRANSPRPAAPRRPQAK
jgi:hypothetical protein